MAMPGLVAAAQSAQKAVLVLIPLQRGSWNTLDIDDTIRTALNDGLAGQLDYYTEYLDVARFPEPDYQSAVRDFFRRKYARQTFDMVIATTDVTLEFVKAYRDELFPGCGGRVRRVESASEPVDTASWTVGDRRRVAGGPEKDDRRRDPAPTGPPRRIRGQRGVGHRPRLSGLGAGTVSRLRRPASLRLLRPGCRFKTCCGGCRHCLSTRLSTSSRSSTTATTASLTGSRLSIRSPRWRTCRPTCGSTRAWDTAASAAVCRASSRRLVAVANVALRVLKGESPERIPVREIDAHITQFDWRQLRHFGISETRLPAGSLVRFRRTITLSEWDPNSTLSAQPECSCGRRA